MLNPLQQRILDSRNILCQSHLFPVRHFPNSAHLTTRIAAIRNINHKLARRENPDMAEQVVFINPPQESQPVGPADLFDKTRCSFSLRSSHYLRLYSMSSSVCQKPLFDNLLRHTLTFRTRWGNRTNTWSERIRAMPSRQSAEIGPEDVHQHNG
jgi:hypothetical protein